MKEQTFEEIMDLTLVQAEPVVMDYETMKEKLSATLEQYQGITVTESNIKTCKDKQREVTAIRKQLDDFRKEVKRRYTEPLQIFEDQIKELLVMVDKTILPIKSGIKEFDDIRRNEKKEIAEQILDELVGEYELNSKYAGQIEFRSKYMNLTAKESDVRADIEAQCMALKQLQDNEESIQKTIINAVEMQNKGITAKLVPDVYISLIGKLPTDEIIDRILKRGEEIQRMEREAEEKKTAQEALRQSQNAEKEEQEEQIQEETKTPENASDSISKKKDLYQVTFVITGDEEQQKSVSDFLKANNITYKVEMQIILN